MTGLVKTSTEDTKSRALSLLIVSRDLYSALTLAPFGGAHPAIAEVF